MGIFTSWEAVWHAKVNILIPLVNNILVFLPTIEQCYNLADVKRTVLFLHWLFSKNTVHVAQFIGSKRCYLPMRQLLIDHKTDKHNCLFAASPPPKASKCYV